MLMMHSSRFSHTHLSELDPVVVVVVEGALQVSCELGWVDILQQGLQRRHGLCLEKKKNINKHPDFSQSTSPVPLPATLTLTTLGPIPNRFPISVITA